MTQHNGIQNHSKRPKGIKFYSFWEPTGYGEAGRRYLLGLRETGIPLTWTPLVPCKNNGLWYAPYTGSGVGDSQLDGLCNRAIGYDTVIAHTVPEYFPMIRALEPAAKIYGYTVWETTRIPDDWRPLLEVVDGLLVPCRWNVKVFQSGGVTLPIFVVPHIHHPDIEADSGLRLAVSDDDFVFYSINVWTERKACLHTVRAYLNEFTSEEPVALILKTSRYALNQSAGLFSRAVLRKQYPDTRDMLDAVLREYRNPAKILLVTDALSSGEIASLHRRGDCYLSLTRAEGWGMGAFDACAFANPVIMTGFGGQLDYLDCDKAFLVKHDLVPVLDRNSSYRPDQSWAEPDLEHASRLMRYVFENRPEAQRRGEMLQKAVRQRFSAGAVIETLLDAVTPMK